MNPYLLRTHPTAVRILVLAPVLVLSAYGQGTEVPADAIQKSLRLNAQDDVIVREMEMIRESIERQIGDKGEVKSTKKKTYRVVPVGGQPYQVLIRRDGKELSAEEARKEQQKLDEVIRKRAAETPEQRKRRLAEYDQKWGRNREMFDEIPKAFSFKEIGEDVIDGHPVRVIQADPRPEYQSKSFRTSFLKHMQGKIYLHKQHERAMKIDVLTTGPVSFGWFLAKLAPGTRITIEQMRLPEGMWVTRRFKMNYDVRIALVKQMRGEAEQVMWDFKHPNLSIGQVHKRDE